MMAEFWRLSRYSIVIRYEISVFFEGKCTLLAGCLEGLGSSAWKFYIRQGCISLTIFQRKNPMPLNSASPVKWSRAIFLFLWGKHNRLRLLLSHGTPSLRYTYFFGLAGGRLFSCTQRTEASSFSWTPSLRYTYFFSLAGGRLFSCTQRLSAFTSTGQAYR